MKAIMMYVCKCGKVRICGNWSWEKTPISLFIQRAIKKEVQEICFEIIKCPTCQKNGIMK